MITFEPGRWVTPIKKKYPPSKVERVGKACATPLVEDKTGRNKNGMEYRGNDRRKVNERRRGVRLRNNGYEMRAGQGRRKSDRVQPSIKVDI